MLASRNALLVGSASLAVLLVAGCASSSAGGGPAGGAPAAVTVTPELIEQGRVFYTNPGRCNVCHGTTGQGGRVGPNLTDDTWLWIDPQGDLHTQLFTIIKEGVSEPKEAPVGMPPMGGAQLTDEQIHAIAAYIASL